jgi:nucleoside-diphosphate-sugar epimerase
LSAAFSGKRALITGGLGFIGSNLARQLVDLGAKVLLVDSLIPEYGGNLFNVEDLKGRATVNVSDIRDEHSLKHLVQGQDFLFNLAGQTSHMDSMTKPMTDLEINCRAQLSLLETCRSHNPTVKIVFASTRQVYGRPRYLPVDEAHPVCPVDVNGIHKLAGEQYHLLYGQVHGLRVSALRLTNTYGPGMRIRDARQTFLGIWMRCAVEGKPFEVWGGEQLRDFNFVDDAVDGFLRAATSEDAEGQVFNLGSREVLSLLELAELMRDVCGGTFERHTFPTDRKSIDIGDYHADFGRATEALGWTPKVSLREGLTRTFEYYSKHLDHYL